MNTFEPSFDKHIKPKLKRRSWFSQIIDVWEAHTLEIVMAGTILVLLLEIFVAPLI